jgi:hypothetical protein
MNVDSREEREGEPWLIAEAINDLLAAIIKICLGGGRGTLITFGHNDNVEPLIIRPVIQNLGESEHTSIR